MSEEKAKRVSVFAGYKLKEQGIREEDREMWTEIKDVADSNKELRTRVADYEEAHKVLDEDQSRIIRNEKDGYPDGRPDRILTLAERVKAICKYGADYKQWLDEAETRLSTLNAEIEGNGGYKDMLKGFQFKIESLESKLSTLEQSILDLSHPNIKNILSELNQYKSKTVNVVAFHKLEDRLSTLLKASEGMEKALESMIADAHELRAINRQNLGAKRDEKINATYYEDIKKAESVLADFRAVKEGL